MADKNKRKPNRIPIRFADGEERKLSSDEAPEARDDGGLTPEEIGRESAYEDATEVERRINRGDEADTEAGRERADDRDVAGGPNTSELPRSRQDQDTTVAHTGEEEKAEGVDAAAPSGETPIKMSTTSGPALAELLATRAELRRVESELKKLSEEKSEWTDKSARLQADFDNFRKRTERERSETYSRSLGEVVSRLLPVLDNLQRALEAERLVEAKETKEFRHFLHGVELINRQLGGVLESLGVEVVPTVGELFDPHIHEAVATEETNEAEPDTIIQEMQRGYRLGDKLLRPAMVKVATKG
ncbi:MAG: nucleotide exchange factor GrpE [Rubrivivax sp.]|nr:nucleotide exchange factor GrpE [Pyrinomonadaceae bacterium]